MPTELVPQLWDSPGLARARAVTRKDILACTRCSTLEPKPVAFAGPARPKFAIVGEAPGETETKQGRPFVGKSGKLLRALLNEVGFDGDELYWSNVASCWPRADGVTRAPTTDERRNCRSHLVSQLVGANTKYVLLVGATALDAWRSDLKITAHHGIMGVMLGTWVVMPVHHPAAVFRTPGLKNLIRSDLAAWKTFVTIPHEDAFMKVCVKCGVEWGAGLKHDADFIGYCPRHWEKWGGTWQKERDRWQVKDHTALTIF